MKTLLLLTIIPVITIASPKTIRDIPPPHDFHRVAFPEGSYSAYLTSLPLKKGKKIVAHDGSTIQNRGYRIFAVIALPLLFRQDLEQCADFSFRLWAEYHKTYNTLNTLYLFDYNGNKKYLSKSGKSYRSFLKKSMGYANSYSIKKGCLTVKAENLRPGDMFVQNEDGGIGHVSVIMDMCESADNEKRYLIGYSFMPAQEFHLEYARDSYGSGGWFSFEGYTRYLSDHMDFGTPVLRRFSE